MVLRVPATSANLGPGFDSLGLALELYNHFTLKPSKITSIQINGEGEKNPKLRIDNVFVRIFNQQTKKLCGEIIPCRFSFTNAIPISRGLGSSSAVIIGAISAAYQITNQTFDKQKILNTALDYESHPDNITPACMGGFNACMLIGQQVRFLNKKLPQNLKAVVLIPNQSISTHISRQTLPKKYSQKDAIFNLSRSAVLASAFFEERWDLLKEASQDRFHQYYRMKQIPMLFEVQKIALQNGALLSTLSGSGSTFLNLCYADDAKHLHQILANKFPKPQILTLNFDNQGVVFDDGFKF